MSFRPICCAAPLALMVGIADVSAREAATAAALRPPVSSATPRDRPLMTPASLRVAPPALGGQRPRAAEPRAVAAPASDADDAPPDKMLALLSALGAMVLVIGRRLRRER
jgi:hypothetical protein